MTNKLRIKIINKFKILLTVTLVSFIISCEDVIEVDLDSAEPQIVIEGSVTNENSPYTVYISKSGDFYEPSIFVKVTGANITISDSRGNSELLTETEDGLYESTSVGGTPGDTYYISVKTEDKEYKAESTMPFDVIELDSISVEPSTIGRHSENSYDLWLYFQDIPGVKNYCRFRVFHNDNLLGGFQLYDDRLSDGNYIQARIRLSGKENKIIVGDDFRVELLTIDKANYDYFNTANDISASGDGGMGPGSVAPSNPFTNWDNNALGYFGAFTVSTAFTIVQE